MRGIFMKVKALFLGCLILVSSNFILTVQAGEYDEFEQVDIQFSNIDKEAEYWVTRSELLIRRIDALIAKYHQEKNRDLDNEALQHELAVLDSVIAREKQLIEMVENHECNLTNECFSLAKHQERLNYLLESRGELLGQITPANEDQK